MGISGFRFLSLALENGGAIVVSKIIEKINRENLQEVKLDSFSVGDNVRVHAKVREGDKERIQIFAGIVIAKDGGAAGTFTVRRISHGVGVERVFPMSSPHIAKIEVESSSRVRRAKLYFLRRQTGRKTRLKGENRE